MTFVISVGWIIFTLIAIKLLYSVYHFINSIYLIASLGHSLDLRRYGPWAVVTGATDGLGEAYARKLASLGMNIVLIDQSYSKLQEVAYEIKREHHTVHIRTIAADFTEGQSIYPMLRFELANLPSGVGLLVNSIGMDVPLDPSEELTPDDEIQKIINCNIMAMTRLTNMLLPGMIQKQRGIIINVGPLWGNSCSNLTKSSEPYNSVYKATKAFVEKFSRDLAAECRQDGIVIQSVMPERSTMNISSLKTMPFLCLHTPDAYVEANLLTLGIESTATAYWIYKIIVMTMKWKKNKKNIACFRFIIHIQT
ncbi:very-long-chain 3-oxoacyl-CoA reductase-like isoform X1 [Daphnia carinata]|uniref:very-long-chain 3-oxoacyl-CoA reductase-like isoform X1 n=1 Tax=Daphnia carinata TaxID=120202 RepID=UPI00257AEB48|nr:very-long-chain 3-oxoacyl-CoA reductase-like isoform X1 [Daphnia carinata]